MRLSILFIIAMFTAATGWAEVVDASHIFTVYSQNRINGDDTFKDRHLAVKGIVQGISSRKDGTLIVNMESGGTHNVKLTFFFTAANKEAVKALSNGQMAIIEGDCTGINQRGNIIEFQRATVTGNATLAAAPDTQRTDCLSKLVTIEGNKGSGTGFIAEWEGKKVVFTNMHVLLNCGELRMTDFSNTELDPVAIRFSTDRDLVIVELSKYNKPGLKIASGCDAELMNQTIRIYGNSQGAGVNTELSGAIVGIGPKKLEITAPIVEGNSGSPILVGNEVIGVATSVMVPSSTPASEASRFYQLRRFGVRIDGLKTDHFQAYDGALYRKDSTIYRMTGYYSEMLYKFLINPWVAGEKVNLTALDKYPELMAIAKDWNQIVTSNARYRRESGNSDLASDTRFNNLISKKLRSLFESPVKKAGSYVFHYQFMGEECKNNLEVYHKMMEFFTKYENHVTIRNTENESSRKRMTARPAVREGFSERGY